VSELWRKSQWINPSILALRSETIREYDLADAGMSVVRSGRLLPARRVSELEALPKAERVVAVGRICAVTPGLAEALNEGIASARKLFLEANSMSEDDVLAVRRDAVSTINLRADALEFGEYHWRQKAKWSSYLRLERSRRRTELLWSSWDHKMDVKGVPREAKEACTGGILADLSRLISQWESLSPERWLPTLARYRGKYVRMELLAESYRELNDAHCFRLKLRWVGDELCLLELGDESLLQEVDPYFNYVHLIAPLVALTV
jgi:hypothetical protein